MSNIMTEKQIEIAHRIIDERLKDLAIIEEEAPQDQTELVATQMVKYAVSRKQANYLKERIKEDIKLSENTRNFILSLLPENQNGIGAAVVFNQKGKSSKPIYREEGIDPYDDWRENDTMFV